jgi:ElaB/YqjD/DUF883 family membrane-anchored ribosome-binding protein
LNGSIKDVDENQRTHDIREEIMKIDTATVRDTLAEDLRAVIGDTEELLKATASQAGDQIQSVRKRVEATLRSARDRVEDLEVETLAKVKAAAKATDQYVHQNPWPSIGIAAGVAAGVGLIAGWLLGRK